MIFRGQRDAYQVGGGLDRVSEGAWFGDGDYCGEQRGFPPQERYALTGQARQSSQPVSLNLCQAQAKRGYKEHFVSKLTDCHGGDTGIDSALDFSRDCGYITAQKHSVLPALSPQVGKMLGRITNNPPSLSHL